NLKARLILVARVMDESLNRAKYEEDDEGELVDIRSNNATDIRETIEENTPEEEKFVEKAESGVNYPSNPSTNCRVQLQNLPRYMGHKQIKIFLAKHLQKSSLRKIRMFSDTVYFSLSSSEEASKAIDLLNGFELKGHKITARICAPEPIKGRDISRSHSDIPVRRSAREIVTPLADIDYNEQLERKMADAKRLATTLVRQMVSANVKDARSINAWELVQPIRRSPQTSGYRNKCEFTVGNDLEGNICVGFVGGRFSASLHYILPMDECTNISERMKGIVNAFQKFVVDSEQAPFNEFERTGLWKMLTVREFIDDVMIIVTIFPMIDSEKEGQLKEALVERFLRVDTLSDEENKFRVTSIYWQKLANASDPPVYEHIAGTPYIYETIVGVRFRISPGAFFQTNSYGAAVLYSTIAEKTNLLSATDDTSRTDAVDLEGMDLSGHTEGEFGNKSERSASNVDLKIEKRDVNPKESSNEVTVESDSRCIAQRGAEYDERSVERSEQIAAKKRKLDQDYADMEKNPGKMNRASKATVILDVCCGTGTIGLCLLSLLKNSKSTDRRYLIGIEMVPEAIEDAKCNASENMFTEEECHFVSGKAEDVFRGLRHYMPTSIKLDEANVVAILDPPRAGIHEKVVLGCRMLSSLKRLIFVSCEPSLALKNFVDLCRPKSKKYDGEPFKLTSITPIDMFPQTKHCEWVVELDR
uniref:tRNA (uracil(54)-C(5))-methyltransferase n=2 Tax=Parascaris univalens TaxID=6257 RepID=A0A915B449_PARUN